MSMISSPNDDPVACPPVLRGIHAALGPDLMTRIRTCRILLVGSGGIGCELLKNLALSGFRHVEIIDLDTIDVSNLNRQFLFRGHHVGLPKCVVASAAALRMVPSLSASDGNVVSARYLPHHGNICDNSKFNVPYVKGFALVLNALDNVAARRHVNRLCLAASVPLVEAGTAGYLGQVTVIDRAAGTECYECQTKPTQKVYPICTIRSTPSQPVHCIVWAKELYKLCFGPLAEDSMLFEDEASLRSDTAAAGGEGDRATDGNGDWKREGDNSDESRNVRGNGTEEEGSTYMAAVRKLRDLMDVAVTTRSLPRHDEATLRAAAQRALTGLFDKEIRKQITMDRYKTAETVPVPIAPGDVAACTTLCSAVPPTAREGYRPTDVWSPADCVSEIAACFVEVSAVAAPRPLPAFDKDDDVAMRFVTAAANLRAVIFAIEPRQSLYGAKGIAGNIIPAIATTNAIVAGLQVLQAFHILRWQVEASNKAANRDGAAASGTLKERCRYIYCLRDKTRKGYFLQPTALPAPNPGCFVCRNATISLALNTREWTLGMLLSRIVKKELGFCAPTLLLGEDSIVYEEGQDIDPAEYRGNLSKRLADLGGGGVGHGSLVRVEDFTQDLEVEMSVSHKERWMTSAKDNGGGEPREDDREVIEKFEIGGEKPVAMAMPTAMKDETGSKSEQPSSANGSADTKPGRTTSRDDSDEGEIEVVEAEDVSKLESKCSNGANKITAKKRNLVNEDPWTGMDEGAKKRSKV